jgi:hypothetical protein
MSTEYMKIRAFVLLPPWTENVYDDSTFADEYESRPHSAREDCIRDPICIHPLILQTPCKNKQHMFRILQIQRKNKYRISLEYSSQTGERR